MRFLADEDFPLASVLMLRDAGHDVAAGAEDHPGASDREVLSRARAEGRVLLTFDRDHGELIFRRQVVTPPGVVYFRTGPRTPSEPAGQLLSLFAEEPERLTGMLTVVAYGHVRQRPLPEPRR